MPASCPMRRPGTWQPHLHACMQSAEGGRSEGMSRTGEGMPQQRRHVCSGCSGWWAAVGRAGARGRLAAVRVAHGAGATTPGAQPAWLPVRRPLLLTVPAGCFGAIWSAAVHKCAARRRAWRTSRRTRASSCRLQRQLSVRAWIPAAERAAGHSAQADVLLPCTPRPVCVSGELQERLPCNRVPQRGHCLAQCLQRSTQIAGSADWARLRRVAAAAASLPRSAWPLLHSGFAALLRTLSARWDPPR